MSTAIAFWLRYCSDVARRKPTKLCTMSGRLLGWYTIYTFSGAVALTEFCPVQKSLYVQVLRSPILAALLHGTPAAGVSQTLQRRTRNGITELSQTVPPIFGRAAITLSIGPHSSTYLFIALRYGHGRGHNWFYQLYFHFSHPSITGLPTNPNHNPQP